MNISKVAFFIATIVLLAACSDPRPPAEIVAERAQARWDALVARDFETAWEYYTPGFRQQNPAGAFAADMTNRPVKWTRATISQTECSESEPRCEVRSRVEYRVPARIPGAGALTSKSAVTEIWLQIDGEWWYSADA